MFSKSLPMSGKEAHASDKFVMRVENIPGGRGLLMEGTKGCRTLVYQDLKNCCRVRESVLICGNVLTIPAHVLFIFIPSIFPHKVFCQSSYSRNIFRTFALFTNLCERYLGDTILVFV